MNSKKQPRPSEEAVMALADDLAQAATTFAGQGYQQFLNAREAVKAAINILYERRNTTRP